MTNSAGQPAGLVAVLSPGTFPKNWMVFPITGPETKPASEPDVLTIANSDAAPRPPMSVVAAQQVGCAQSAKNLRAKKTHTIEAAESNARLTNRQTPASMFPVRPMPLRDQRRLPVLRSSQFCSIPPASIPPSAPPTSGRAAIQPVFVILTPFASARYSGSQLEKNISTKAQVNC